MSKYSNISTYLLDQDHSKPLRLPFSEIEHIIGSPLPESARLYQAWWANQSGKGHSQAFSWACVGWRTGEVDLGNELVTFTYEAERLMKEHAAKLRGENHAGAAEKQSGQTGLTIAEAKQRLALTFGVEPDQIEIIIKG